MKKMLVSLSLFGLLSLDFVPGTPLGLGFIPEAVAIVGRPLTPVSAAGVARRTTRRVVATDTAVVATTAAAVATTSAAAAAASAPPPPPAGTPAPAPTPAAFAVGTTVSALPEGCVSTTISGTEYFNCGGTYFKPAFQGNNLVYVVTEP